MLHLSGFAKGMEKVVVTDAEINIQTGHPTAVRCYDINYSEP